MRRFALAASAVLLAACTPPAPTSTQTTAPTQAQQMACNDVTPDAAKLVQLQEAPRTAAALNSDLAGGRIAPGLYDLSGGYVSGGAPAWTATRAAALQVSEADAGVTFNYAEIGGNDAHRWTGAFHEGPPAGLDYTCGLSGHVDIRFAAQPTQLQIRVPDAGGAGFQTLIFTRRA